jgi:hypothetical protein
MTRLEILDAKRLVAADKLREAERTFENMSLNYEAARVSLTIARQEHRNLVDQIRLVKKLEAS